MKYLVEAIVVGIACVVIGMIVLQSIFKIRETNVSNEVLILFSITLFITGFLGHVISEKTGVNKWYCENGNACVEKLARLV